MKKLCSLILVFLLALSLFAGCSQTKESPVKGKKVAYIMHMAESEIFKLWSSAAKKAAESVGMEYSDYFCNGSDEEWKNKISECAEQGYDGLLLSHGGKEYAYTFLTDILKKYPDLKIVTFDTEFADSEGKKQTIDGVTQFFQQDSALASLLLDYACNTIYKDKTANDEKINILKIWKGPQYIAAFDRRQIGYEEYENRGHINTVEVLAPDDLSDAEASIKQITAEALKKYKTGEIDAVWCCYDLYARGVYEALKESGCNIPLLSVDICNADIEKMQEDGSCWEACATTNWSFNGEFGMRALALELAGEYDKITDPATGLVSNWLELPASLITQDMLSENVSSVEDLASVAGDSYNDRSMMLTSDWMK